MGLEPMTNGLLDQRSTDWAMRPTVIISTSAEADITNLSRYS